MNQPINKFQFNKGLLNKGDRPQTQRPAAPHVNKLIQSLKDSDGDGVSDALEGLIGRMGGGRQGFGFMRGPRCQTGNRGTLLRRPVIPLRIRANNVSINTSSGILAQLIASTGWSNGGVNLSGTNAGRTLLSRVTDPNQFYSQVQDSCVRFIKPFVRVNASRPGEPMDKHLSEQIRQLILDNFVVVLDPDGKGKNLALAPTYFGHLTNRGIILDDDQVFEFGDNSVLRFDYNGVGEQGGADSSYSLADLTPQAAFTVSVIVGFDIIISAKPDDNVDAMIEDAQGIA